MNGTVRDHCVHVTKGQAGRAVDIRCTCPLRLLYSRAGVCRGDSNRWLEILPWNLVIQETHAGACRFRKAPLSPQPRKIAFPEGNWPSLEQYSGGQWCVWPVLFMTSHFSELQCNGFGGFSGSGENGKQYVCDVIKAWDAVLWCCSGHCRMHFKRLTFFRLLRLLLENARKLFTPATVCKRGMKLFVKANLNH